MEEAYLENIRFMYNYYRKLGSRALEQMSAGRINWYFHNDSNSVAIIVKHLHGNMLSRFTDFLTSDGDKDWRNRDDEFVDDVSDKEAMLQLWEEGWNCVMQTLNDLTPEDMLKKVKLRGEELTVLEALNRQLGHYSYHIGQIVYLARMLTKGEWTSLSIPKGESMLHKTGTFKKN